MRDFDRRYPDARATSGKASWPRGVHRISEIGLDNIGVDDEGRLYWNGQMVKEANPLRTYAPAGSQCTHRRRVGGCVGSIDTRSGANR
jgi:hypothetical protein